MDTGLLQPAETESGQTIETPALEIRGLRKSFGPHAVLDGLDLTVPARSLTAILGPSGSGKTTLLRIVAGFERADGGTVTIGGELADGQHHQVRPEDRSIGYVPQEGALFPHLSVGRNVAFGIPRAQRRSGVVGDLLELVGMRGMGRRYPHELSGGQQQRVALARALAVSPTLVLLDEPFSSLDPRLRSAVRDDVARVLRSAGTTALLVTHDQDEALSWSDHVAVIHAGRIGQYDVPAAVYAHPAGPELARFVGDANLLRGTFGRDRPQTVDTVLGTLQTTVPREVSPDAGSGCSAIVLVRPEQLDVALLGADGAGDDQLVGEVVDYQFFGHDAVMGVRTTRPTGAERLVVRITGGTALQVGEQVSVRCRGPVLAWPAPENTPS